MYAVTGLGVVSPLADKVPALWESVRTGQSAIRPLPEELGGGVGVRFEEPPESGLDRRLLAAMDPVSIYAAIAGSEAYQQAEAERIDKRRVGTVVGVGVGGINSLDNSYHRLYSEGRRVNALAIPRVMPSAAASGVSMALGLQGPTFVVSSACASSAHALVEATHWLDKGRADAMLAIGAEAPFAHGLMMGWKAMHILAPDTCRPFCARRKGMVVGEGAAALLIERPEHAKARGAEVLANLLGYGVSADAYHLVKPEQSSIEYALQEALEESGVLPEQIDYVNAHGTGTQTNDATEGAALREMFGSRCPAVSSTKGATGHTLGAAGAMEAVITIGAIRGGWIPPTLNVIEKDADIDLDICSGTSRAAEISCAMSNSFAFGGLNACLVIAKADDEPS